MSHADDTILEDTVGGQAVADVARIKPSVKAGRPCADVPDDISASVERAGRALAFQDDSSAPVTCEPRNT